MREEYLRNKNSKKIRNRKGNFKDVDEVFLQWLTQMRAKNAVVSGPWVLEKAAQFAVSLGVDHFSASSGWLERFKYRHNITFARIYGEKADAYFMGADQWIRNVLPNERLRLRS